MKTKITLFLLLLLFINGNLVSQDSKVKNIILMIGDGMGRNQALSASYYLFGKDSGLVFQSFPKQYYMSTYPGKANIKGKYTLGYNTTYANSDFEYLKVGYTDSAPAATAMSTGVKSFDGAIGLNLDSNKLEHITAVAKKKGKSAGVVTTVQISHATPAGFVAHNVSRNNYSEIAQEMLNSDMNVIIGAGHPMYDNDGKPALEPDYQYVGGKELWQNIKSTKWQLVEKKSDFERLQSGDVSNNLLGILPVYKTANQERSNANNSKLPFEVPLNSTVPSLATTANVALNVLDNNQSGFFLMVEGGAIDWACHDNQLGRMVEETNDFNDAVKSVINWVEINSNWNETLLVVTGDHETGYITGPNKDDNSIVTNPIINNGKGKLPKMRWNSDNHSNSLVPVYIMGNDEELFKLFADEIDLVRGRYINNTELSMIFRLLIQRN